jgi:hypothetical protein
MNSKRKGNAFEVEAAFRLREVFPNARTCRFMGKLWLDECKVDISDTDPFYFQCKATEKAPSYHSILAEMPQSKNINVILHKRNRAGTVAVMDFEDFLKLIKKNK